jgi:hypothetical protein
MTFSATHPGGKYFSWKLPNITWAEVAAASLELTRDSLNGQKWRRITAPAINAPSTTTRLTTAIRLRNVGDRVGIVTVDILIRSRRALSWPALSWQNSFRLRFDSLYGKAFARRPVEHTYEKNSTHEYTAEHLQNYSDI